MINYNTEYFDNGRYFFLKDRGDTISLYYTIADTLTESRKKDEKKVFDKKYEKVLKKFIHSLLKSKKKISKNQIDKGFDKLEKGELDELIDFDGTFLNSKIPFLNQTLTPHKTTDQTIAMSRVTNDPVTRGYRVYWGESEDEEGNIVAEVNLEDAFGYEETKDLNGPDTFETFIEDLGVSPDEAADRTAQQGKEFDKKEHKKKLKRVPKKIKNDPNFIDTLTLVEKKKIEEIRKEKMTKMVEDIITKKSKDESDVVGKDSTLSKILMNNLKSIKKLADKEGISLSQLMKALKNHE